jgi:hypothetical protein
VDQIADPSAIKPPTVKSEEEERDQPFNAYRFAASEGAKAIVAEAVRLLRNCEDYFGLRQNKRRPRDRETFNLAVDAVLSDLMHHYVTGLDGDIYITRSNKVLGTRSRYRPRVYSKMLPYILDLMAKPEMAYVAQEIGVQVFGGRSRMTVIRPGKRLLSRIEEYEITSEDFGTHPGRETIILKRTKEDYWDEGGFQEYDDTAQTDRFRAELDEINKWLAAADLGFDKAVPWSEATFDLSDRQLRRVFTQGRFDSGGRLFGGFWQSMSKEERRGILISGEEAVELDYGQAGPRILYGMAGHEPPSDDLYFIYGYIAQRAGIKKVMNAMMFATDRLDRFPKETRKLFRRQDKIAEVVAEIERRHPLVQDHFHRGLGHDAQFIESEIMVDVLLRLKQSGVIALPIHDALMVPASKVSIAEEVMLSSFADKARVQGIVKREG